MKKARVVDHEKDWHIVMYGRRLLYGSTIRDDAECYCSAFNKGLKTAREEEYNQKIRRAR